MAVYTTVPCKHNYPIETALQAKFWGSRHVWNQAKAIAAFSDTEEEFKLNLRRWTYDGFRSTTRRLEVFEAFKKYVGDRYFAGIPYSEIDVPYWLDDDWRAHMGYPLPTPPVDMVFSKTGTQMIEAPALLDITIDHVVEFYVRIDDPTGGTNNDLWGTRDGANYGRQRNAPNTYRAGRGSAFTNFSGVIVPIGQTILVREIFTAATETLRVELYNAGGLIGAADHAAARGASSSPLEIGCRTAGQGWTGVIYDFKVYEGGSLHHHWPLNGDMDDVVGGAHGIATGGTFIEEVRETTWG